MTQQEILTEAMRQSAVDWSCSELDFCRETNVIVESVPSEKASRYITVPHVCGLISFGSNIVAACRADLIPEVTAFVNGTEKIYRCFDTPAIYDLNRILQKAGAELDVMHEYFLPDPARIFGADLSCPYETRELHPEDFPELYVPEWSNALSRDRKELDMLGVGAYDKGKLVGLAGCSADGMELWQIGIDVLPEYRRKGIASALTNRLARAVFERGKIPFYGAAWSNIRSVKNGLRSGFRPGWVMMTAKSKTAGNP